MRADTFRPARGHGGSTGISENYRVLGRFLLIDAAWVEVKEK